MIVPKEFYGIKCDFCGKMLLGEWQEDMYDDVECVCYTAKESEWLLTEDEHHYCPECKSLNDDDLWETKDGKKYYYDGEPIMEETEMTIYEKFLAIPKQVEVYLGKTKLEYDFDIHFDSKYNDACCIEYNRFNCLGDYECVEELQWFGTFEECVDKAFNYFSNIGKLLVE